MPPPAAGAAAAPPPDLGAGPPEAPAFPGNDFANKAGALVDGLGGGYRLKLTHAGQALVGVGSFGVVPGLPIRPPASLNIQFLNSNLMQYIFI